MDKKLTVSALGVTVCMLVATNEGLKTPVEENGLWKDMSKTLKLIADCGNIVTFLDSFTDESGLYSRRTIEAVVAMAQRGADYCLYEKIPCFSAPSPDFSPRDKYAYLGLPESGFGSDDLETLCEIMRTFWREAYRIN